MEREVSLLGRKPQQVDRCLRVTGAGLEERAQATQVVVLNNDKKQYTFKKDIIHDMIVHIVHTMFFSIVLFTLARSDYGL